MKSRYRTDNLGNYVRIRTGKLDANANNPNGQYPFFTCAVEPLRIDTNSFDCECVLVAGNGDLNVKYYDGKFDAYQRTYVIESLDKSQLDVRYLYHFMSEYVQKLRKLSIGGVIKYIKLNNLTDAEIPLPPTIDEQRRIAAILDKADAIRRKRQKSIRLTKEFLRSTFLEMFGDPVTNPKGWEQVPLEALIETERGISYGIVQRGAEIPDGVPVVRISNITSNSFGGAEIVRTDPKISNGYKRTILRGGELLLSIRGTVGRVAIVPESAKGWNISREVAVIPLLPEISSIFVHHAMLTDGAQRFMAGEVKGVAQSGINLSDVRRLPIPRPPQQLEQKFISIANLTSSNCERFMYSNGITDELFSSLTHRAFRGEL